MEPIQSCQKMLTGAPPISYITTLTSDKLKIAIAISKSYQRKSRTELEQPRGWSDSDKTSDKDT